MMTEALAVAIVTGGISLFGTLVGTWASQKKTTALIIYRIEQMERTIRRLWILALVLVILLVGTNVAWLWYESQFETIATETQMDVQQEADSNSRNIVIGGDWYGGETDSPG